MAGISPGDRPAELVLSQWGNVRSWQMQHEKSMAGVGARPTTSRQ